MPHSLDKRTRLIAFWILFSILILARAWDLGVIPGDINQDEALAGYNTYTLLHHGKDSFGYSFPMYLTAWGSGMNALESYLAIPFVAVFGLHTWTLRLVPLIAALFTLVVIYRIIREFKHDDLFALFAMFVTGVMPWHIMLSRWALESNLAPAFLCFGLYFMLKGTKNEKYYLLSALFYGLSLYSYATIWVVLPFILLAEFLYLIAKEKVHFSKYTVLSILLLALLALPAILFVLVNKGVIDEIRTPFLSIPRLLYFRGDEVSFSAIGENLENLWNILWHQSDGLPWNADDRFGIIYRFSLPFAGVGLLAILIPAIRNRHRRIHHWIATGDRLPKQKTGLSLGFFAVIHLLAGLVLGALISVNINRVNILFLPLILIMVYGWYFLITKILKSEKWILLPEVLYLFCFVFFINYYFNDYKNTLNVYFSEGIEDVMEYTADELADVPKVYCTSEVNYARVLFYDKTDLNTWLNTVDYSASPSGFFDIHSFDRYRFDPDLDAGPDRSAAYIIDPWNEDNYLVQALKAEGYLCYRSHEIAVYYPANLSRTSPNPSP